MEGRKSTSYSIHTRILKSHQHTICKPFTYTTGTPSLPATGNFVGRSSAALAQGLSRVRTLAGGIAEELAAGLQAGAPSFFKEDDKTFFRAAGLLQRAADCGAPAERDTLAGEALKLLSRVPLAADLGQVAPQLLALHQTAGVIELALQVCAH